MVSTAAALIIGDEILTGKVRDKNSFVLAQILFEQGIDLTRIIVISDEIDQIATDIRCLASEHDYVFTSGGIGPTHDDKTYAGVAKAFGRKLAYNEEALSVLMARIHEQNPGEKITDARKRMAYLPEPCEILWTPGIWVPLIVVENVYVLPGIPDFFEMMLEAARPRFVGVPKERILVYTQMPESVIADALSATQKQFADVAIGSYPKLADPNYRVMVSIEGRDRIRVQQAAEAIERAVNGFR